MSKTIQIASIHKEEEISVIRNLFDRSNQLTDAQISVFLSIAKEKKLDPRLKQICAVPKFNSSTQKTDLVTIVQIDGFRLIAERTGKYAPGQDTEFLFDDNKRLIGAKVYVKKLTEDGTWHQVSATAFLHEYSTGKGIWKMMPSVMIEKCAEARALRRAFPGEMSGIYADEEMNKALEDSILPEPTKTVITHEQAEKIRSYVSNKDGLERKILNLCQVKSIGEIRLDQLDACRNFITQQIKKEHQNVAKIA